MRKKTQPYQQYSATEKLEARQPKTKEPQIFIHSYSSSYSNLGGKESEYSRDLEYANGEGYLTITKNGKTSTKKITLDELYELDLLENPFLALEYPNYPLISDNYNAIVARPRGPSRKNKPKPSPPRKRKVSIK